MYYINKYELTCFISIPGILHLLHCDWSQLELNNDTAQK